MRNATTATERAPAPRAGRWGLLVLLLGLGAALPATATEPRAGEQVVDRVVATVDDALITLSDLRLEAAVMLVQQGGAEAARATPDEALLARVLELSIAQRLQAREADRLGVFPLEPGERAALVEAFQRRLGGEAALRAFLEAQGSDEPQLAALLERNHRAERALEGRLRARAQVAEAEVRRRYERQAGAQAQPYAEVRDRLREELLRERYREAVAEEVALLKRGVRIRRVAPFAREYAREEAR